LRFSLQRDAYEQGLAGVHRHLTKYAKEQACR
jgi:hypothetical protein